MSSYSRDKSRKKTGERAIGTGQLEVIILSLSVFRFLFV